MSKIMLLLKIQLLLGFIVLLLMLLGISFIARAATGQLFCTKEVSIKFYR